jgi:hypothetical protein
MKNIQMYECEKSHIINYELPLTDEEIDLLDHHLGSFNFDDLGIKWKGRLVITEKVLGIIDRLKRRVEDSIRERMEELPYDIIKYLEYRKYISYGLYNGRFDKFYSNNNQKDKWDNDLKRELYINLEISITFLTDNVDKNEDNYRRFDV